MVSRKIIKTEEFTEKLEKMKKPNHFIYTKINDWIIDVSTKNNLSKFGIDLGEKFSQQDLQTYNFLKEEYYYYRINDYYIVFYYDNQNFVAQDISNTKQLKLERKQERTLKDDLEKEEQEKKKLTNSFEFPSRIEMRNYIVDTLQITRLDFVCYLRDEYNGDLEAFYLEVLKCE
jgi:hypothetical protein